MADGAVSAYERARAANIERNRQVMLSLGLGPADVSAHRELRGVQSNGASQAGDKEPSVCSVDQDKGTRSLRKSKPEREVVRRSARQRGLAPDGAIPRVQRRARAIVTPTTEHHAAAERDHLRWAGKQKRSAIVGTASYKHTLQRVLSMSEQALDRRIHAIERACGQHAVVKMRLFARVLSLEGLHDLAHRATQAYERLRKKLGDPTSENE